MDAGGQKKVPPKWIHLFSNPLYRKGLFTGFFVTAATAIYGQALDSRRKNKLDVTEQMVQIEPCSEDLNILERGRKILKYGAPERGSDIRYYSNHALVYDQQKKTPVWVAEHITADRLTGSTTRKNVKFKPDPAIAEMFTAKNSDYLKSGWSRGHLNPAGDNKMSKASMEESFYLSNIVPQNFENNAGFWNRLEMYCRDLTKRYSSVYIISGPLVLPELDSDGSKVIKYKVIGQSEVTVPTHLFKVIIIEDRNSKPTAIGAFIVPNKPIGFEHSLTEYQVDMEELERVSGMNLTPKLDRDTLKNLCKVDGCKLMSRDKFELYFIGRKLESANTLHRLEKVWAELDQKNLKPDKYLIDLYNKKILEIKEEEKKDIRN